MYHVNLTTMAMNTTLENTTNKISSMSINSTCIEKQCAFVDNNVSKQTLEQQYSAKLDTKLHYMFCSASSPGLLLNVS